MASSFNNIFSNLNGPLILRSTSTVLGFVICTTMVRGSVQPVAFAETFGLPLSSQPSLSTTTSSQKENQRAESALKDNPWLLPLVARNGMLGVSILTFNYLGMTKATGVVMTIGAILMGIGDVVATARWGTRDGVIAHSIGAAVFGGVGAGLLWVTSR